MCSPMVMYPIPPTRCSAGQGMGLTQAVPFRWSFDVMGPKRTTNSQAIRSTNCTYYREAALADSGHAGWAIDGCSGSVLPACQLLFSHWPTVSRGKSYLRPIARAVWPKPTPGPERHRQALKRGYAHVSCLALSTSLAVREDVNR